MFGSAREHKAHKFTTATRAGGIAMGNAASAMAASGFMVLVESSLSSIGAMAMESN